MSGAELRMLLFDALAWVYCVDVAGSTNPGGVGGQALTRCGICSGCRLADRISAALCDMPLPDQQDKP